MQNKLQEEVFAVKDADTFVGWIEKYGNSKIILGADCNNENIAISGWQEESQLQVMPFIKEYQTKGVKYVICTDIAKDGMLEGPSFKLYKQILQEAENVKLIASGGITTIDDINKLEDLGCEGAIIEKHCMKVVLALEN